MTKPIVLDSGPLGRLAHPRPKAEAIDWLAQTLGTGVEVIISEVTDFEVRRNLLLEGKLASVQRLDELKESLTYLPITTAVMLDAAELWADARRRGQPTADPKELDCDVILAAQARSVGAIIATTNVGHLARYATAVDWRSLKTSP